MNANDLRPYLDLFGVIPVTMSDIVEYVDKITHGRITPDRPFFNYYWQNWDIPAKIRRQRLKGHL